ncbi:hypothetical protein [Corynebacterium sp. HS2168-gen11]|uniref:hypothetical protein n=1 Tax=Corynebacterium sp. HS2168-gen11 TaxID=2974027 RepID=UPI00216B5005|nr:hypothetical protein [Corynebacterium sp. HS2168-gen11]MCS4535189.1 hypothetical protein [Corynebacterium sp. HS2168-gen11]
MRITRKTLASVIVAATLSTGLATPAFADVAHGAHSVPNCHELKTQEEKNKCKEEIAKLSSSERAGLGSRDKNGRISPKEIGSWIAIISTVITLLTSALTFFAKVPNMFKK